MTNETISILGLFDSDDAAAVAIRNLKKSPWSVERVHSPVPSPKIMNALNVKKSRVGWFTLAGGILGFLAGFGLAVFSATRWNLIVGGKPVVAWVPFFIVGFEFTILFAVMGNIIGLLTLARLPQFRPPGPVDPGFSGARFGVIATCARSQETDLSHFFRDNGATVMTVEKPTG